MQGNELNWWQLPMPMPPCYYVHGWQRNRSCSTPWFSGLTKCSTYFKVRSFPGIFNQHLKFGFKSPQTQTGISWCKLNTVLLRWQWHLNNSFPTPCGKKFFQVFLLFNIVCAVLYNSLTALLAMRKGIKCYCKWERNICSMLNMQLENVH